MKKILLSLILVSVFMVGCSNINTNIKDSCQDLVKNFFDSMNSIEDYTNESELAKLNEYFTDDSDVKDKLIHYLTIFESERQGEVVNNTAKIKEIKNENGLYRVLVQYDIISKDTKKVLNQSDMYLYIKDEDGQLKIKTADYGG